MGRQLPREDSDDGGDSGVPTILNIWQSPGPTCPGAKYPVRGIPHFDFLFGSLNLDVRISQIFQQPNMLLSKVRLFTPLTSVPWKGHALTIEVTPSLGNTAESPQTVNQFVSGKARS